MSSATTAGLLANGAQEAAATEEYDEWELSSREERQWSESAIDAFTATGQRPGDVSRFVTDRVSEDEVWSLITMGFRHAGGNSWVLRGRSSEPLHLGGVEAKEWGQHSWQLSYSEDEHSLFFHGDMETRAEAMQRRDSEARAEYLATHGRPMPVRRRPHADDFH